MSELNVAGNRVLSGSGQPGMYCGNCGQPMPAADKFCGACGTARATFAIQDVVKSQVAIGNGNVQIQLTVEGTSQYRERAGGIELHAREIPVLVSASRADLVGRAELIEQASLSLSHGTTVQLFGAAGVGRTAVAEAILRRQAEARVRGVQLLPGNEPHTLESLYRRLAEVFFGVTWYQPEEAVLRMEAAKADLRALVMVADCDLPPDDLGRLLGTFPSCTFLLTSRRKTLPEDAGTAYEVDALDASQARELITRALGDAPSGLRELQWEQAYRLAGGQVQRLVEHVAFIKRAAARPGQTDLINVPVKEQITILVAGLTEPARRVLVALASYPLALAPAVFGAITGLPAAEHSADELVAAGVISAEGEAFRIVPDAAEILAGTGEKADSDVAADGLMRMLASSGLPDPHLVLAVARAVHQAGDDTRTSMLTRAGAPAALAAGAIGVWVSLVALGFQAATSSRRRADLEFFLNEQHTGALLTGDTIAAAAALAALRDLLAEQQGHASVALHTAERVTRPVRHARKVLLGGHHPIPIIAGAVAAAAVVGTIIVVAVVPGSSPPALSLTGAWHDSSGSTWSFTSTGADRFNVGVLSKGTVCQQDGEVTGTGADYTGTINLYPQNSSSGTGCSAKTSTATITIKIGTGGNSASVNIVGKVACQDCVPQTWTKASTG